MLLGTIDTDVFEWLTSWLPMHPFPFGKHFPQNMFGDDCSASILGLFGTYSH